MSVFPLCERVLLYVWKVVRVVIQCGCRRWCVLAARQSVENGPRPAVSRAFVCLCLTRRLLVHRSTASTHLAKEQRGHYQLYLISTLPQLNDTRGQTAAGPGRPALPGHSVWSGHWSGLGGPLSTEATPKLWTNINTKACSAGCQGDARKQSAVQVVTKRRRGQAWWAAASWKASAKWNTTPFFFLLWVANIVKAPFTDTLRNHCANKSAAELSAIMKGVW